MKQKQSLSRWILLVLCVCLVFAGCSSSASSSQSSSNTAIQEESEENLEASGTAENVELRAAWWGGPDRNDMMNAIYDRYEELHPGVTITREFSEWNDYWIKYSTQLAGGNPPDIIQFTDRELEQYVDQNAAVLLNPYIESGALDLSNFDESAIAAGSIGDDVYMVSMGLSTPVIEYNKTALEKTSLGVPTDNMSWNEFTDYLTQLASSNELPEGMYALKDPCDDGAWFLSYLRQLGKTLTDENGNLGFAKEDAVNWFQWVEDMRQAGVIPPYSVTAEYLNKPKEEAQIVTGSVAMFAVAGNQTKIYQNNMEDECDISRLPTMPDGVNPRGEIVMGAYLSVSPTSEHIDQAVDVVSFFVNDIESNRIFNCEQGIPSSVVVQEGIEDLMHPLDVRVKELLNETLLDIPAPQPSPNGTLGIYTAILQCNEIIAYGQMSVDEACTQFMQDCQTALDEAKR